MRIYPILFIFFIFSWGSSNAASKLVVEYPEHPYPNTKTIYEIVGDNKSKTPVPVIIRIDDKNHPSYAQRVNEERWVLPGPFKIMIQPASLQTPQNEFLTLNALKKTIVFSDSDVDFSTIKMIYAKHQPKAEENFFLAYDFGGSSSPTFPGFTAVDETSSIFGNTKPTPFIKKSADSLIRDGLRKITNMRIPIRNGNWRVHLWTENLGEWETLPALYERRIRINRTDRSLIRRSHGDWIAQRYLLGQTSSHKETPWQAFGSYRGERSSYDVNVSDGLIRLDFAGSNAQATTVSAMLIEPISNNDKIYKTLQHQRKEWYQQRWPFIDKIQHKPLRQQDVFTAFAGETIFIPLSSGEYVKHINSGPIHTLPLYSAPSFQRSSPNSGLLVRSNYKYSPQYADNSNRSLLRVDVPNNIKPSIYSINLTFKNDQQHTIKVRVSSIHKPNLEKSIGIYLETTPHLKTPETIDMQVWCDLDFIRQLGFNAISPPLNTKPANFLADLNRVNSFGFRDILSYTTVKRMERSDLKSLLNGLDRQNIKQPIWSIADEPSNAGQAQELASDASFIQSTSHFAKKAGHLNRNHDLKYLKYLDFALVNGGFGLNSGSIHRIKNSKTIAWFYNMENRRTAAGFYIWRMNVDGYLQWHGRMPTADPFDPTDGREDDVQLIYPSIQPCVTHPDIDINLIRMVSGMSDLRWLNWLETTAQNNDEARQLLEKIRARIPTSWNDARAISDEFWNKLKFEIQGLAFRLQN